MLQSSPLYPTRQIQVKPSLKLWQVPPLTQSGNCPKQYSWTETVTVWHWQTSSLPKQWDRTEWIPSKECNQTTSYLQGLNKHKACAMQADRKNKQQQQQNGFIYPPSVSAMHTFAVLSAELCCAPTVVLNARTHASTAIKAHAWY